MSPWIRGDYSRIMHVKCQLQYGVMDATAFLSFLTLRAYSMLLLV